MAQKLKDKVKIAIIKAAKDEFSKKSFDDVTVRSIAAKASMTVGNLYRYFKNKEEILNYIVDDTLNKIIIVLNTYNVNNIDLNVRVFKVIPDTKTINKLINKMTLELLKIQKDNEYEFNILLQNQELSDLLYDWFYEIIKVVISQHYDINNNVSEKELVIDALVSSIVCGFKNVFIKDVDYKSKAKALKIYLETYIIVLNKDIEKIIKDVTNK